MSSQGLTHIRVDEILADKEQWLIKVLRQGVSEAVTEIEPCRVTTTAPKSPISHPGNGSLMLRHWFNPQTKAREQRIECHRGTWVWELIDDD